MDAPLAIGLFSARGLPLPDAPVLARVEAVLQRGLSSAVFARAVPAITREDYVAHVARVATAEDLAADAETSLASLHLEDLAFALACAKGDAEAVQTLERTLIEAVPKSLAHVRVSPAAADEVKQELRAKLLVGEPGGEPKILDYKGRGPLGAWVRVVALRLGYGLLRDEAARDARAASDEDALAELASAGDGPDVAQLRATYEGQLRAAFAEAARRLSPEERAVLRSHAVDGLTIDQIGALYQVHRATAARWIQQARASLSKSLRETLAKRLRIDQAGCESVVALVQSRIDLSLERILDDDA